MRTSLLLACSGCQLDCSRHECLQAGKDSQRRHTGGGENLNASQFYVTTGADLDSLDDKHTVFGEVSAVTYLYSAQCGLWQACVRGGGCWDGVAQQGSVGTCRA